MEDMKITIAKNIIELRRKNSMTQAELAEKLNYTDKAVSKWERGMSVPDVIVLKEIADLFGVTVDYLLTAEHEGGLPEIEPEDIHEKANHGLITGMSILLVWLVATLIFVIVSPIIGSAPSLISFVLAVPASLIVWLVFNSLWFNARRNFFIISLLMWVVLAITYLILYLLGINLWLIFVLGIPGQAIILMWSGIRRKKK